MGGDVRGERELSAAAGLAVITPGRARFPVGLLAAQAEGEPPMPSQAMQNLIDAFRDRQKARARQARPSLEELRAAFAPGAVSIRCLATCW